MLLLQLLQHQRALLSDRIRYFGGLAVHVLLELKQQFRRQHGAIVHLRRLMQQLLPVQLRQHKHRIRVERHVQLLQQQPHVPLLYVAGEQVQKAVLEAVAGLVVVDLQGLQTAAGLVGELLQQLINHLLYLLLAEPSLVVDGTDALVELGGHAALVELGLQLNLESLLHDQ